MLESRIQHEKDYRSVRKDTSIGDRHEGQVQAIVHRITDTLVCMLAFDGAMRIG